MFSRLLRQLNFPIFYFILFRTSNGPLELCRQERNYHHVRCSFHACFVYTIYSHDKNRRVERRAAADVDPSYFRIGFNRSEIENKEQISVEFWTGQRLQDDFVHFAYVNKQRTPHTVHNWFNFRLRPRRVHRSSSIDFQAELWLMTICQHLPKSACINGRNRFCEWKKLCPRNCPSSSQNGFQLMWPIC